MEGSGPPPADPSRIEALPKVIVSQELVGEKIERIILMVFFMFGIFYVQAFFCPIISLACTKKAK